MNFSVNNLGDLTFLGPLDFVNPRYMVDRFRLD